MHIGRKIKSLMEASAEHSPGGLALVLGKKNKQTYYDMIKREDINTGDLIKCARYFGVPVTEFFDVSLKGTESKYLEERVRDLETKVERLEKHLSHPTSSG